MEWVQQSERLHRQTGSKLVNEREPEHSALFEYTCPAVMFNCQKLAMINSLLSVHCVVQNEAAF
jgi:hypothetical protein